MAHRKLDSVRQIATGTGTGALALGAALGGKYKTAQNAGLADGDTAYMRIQHSTIDAEWECVRVTRSGTNITRNFDSKSVSATGALISFTAGDKYISAAVLSKAVVTEDLNGNVSITNDLTVGGSINGGGGTTVINITGGNLPAPTTGAQLQTLFDAAASTRSVLMLAPSVKITLTSTIVISQPSHDGNPWGMDGNWAQIEWGGAGGQDMFRVEGYAGVPNRGFVLMNFAMFGNGYLGSPAEACIRIQCPGGDNEAYYKSTLHNLYLSYATYGLVLDGAVFELAPFNIHCENHRSHGMTAVSNGGAIMSNCFSIAPNMSRNGGSGIYSSESHNIIMGSFIHNSRYAIEGFGGMRVVAFCNGENTGESMIKLGDDGYGTTILACEHSAGNVASNNFGLPSTGLSKYVLDSPSGNPLLPNNNGTGIEFWTNQKDCHVSEYNGASGGRVRKQT